MIKELILKEELGMLYPTEKSIKKVRFGLYICGCGKEFRAQMQSVRVGRTKSCGCYNRQKINEATTKHGLYGTRIYRIYYAIKQRCYNPNSDSYKDYGARGITVCDEWLESIVNFNNWAINNGYNDRLEIDRKENDKGYSPDNCRWTDRFTQNQNTRRLRKTNNSGYRGISYNKNVKKYSCNICVNNKKLRLGYFENAIDGAKVRDKYIIDNNLKHTKNF